MAQTEPSNGAVANIIGGFGAMVASAVCLLTVVGFLGGIWWGFDLASHFRVQYAVVLALVLVVLAGVRWRRTAGVAAGALLVNLALIVPLYVAGPAQAESTGTVAIVSFNVTASNPERAAVLEYLGTSDADIIFMHESSTDWEDALSRSGLPYRMVSAREPGSLFGTLALIRGDAVANVLPLGDFGQWSIEVVTDVGGTPVSVLGTHPLSPVSPTRSAARDEQLRIVGDWAARQTNPVVVVGDFNASTWSRGFGLVTRDAGLVNSQRGFGVQPSWPAEYPLFGIPIDHMVHSTELTTVDRRLGENLGSDHFSLFVTVGLAVP